MATHVAITTAHGEDGADNVEVSKVHLDPLIHGRLDGVVGTPGSATGMVFPSV